MFWQECICGRLLITHDGYSLGIYGKNYYKYTYNLPLIMPLGAVAFVLPIPK